MKTWKYGNWHESIAADIYKLTLLEKFAKEYKFKDKIKDSSGSVMDNIAEGFGRESRLGFLNFLGIAKGSLSESESQLYRALNYGLISKETLDLHYGEAEIIASRIASLMIYLNKSMVKGKKFKDRILYRTNHILSSENPKPKLKTQNYTYPPG